VAGHARRARHLRSTLETARPHSRRRPSQARPRRSLLVTALAVLGMLSASGLVASTAHADPSPAEIEAQIDEIWRDLAPVIEQHNATRIELGQMREEIEELEERIAPLQLRVDVAMAEVADMAVYAFKGGNVSTFNALLSSGSPHTLAEQLAVLDQVAKSRQNRIAKVIESKEEYEAQKESLDQLVAELEVREAELAARADEIDAEIERLQALRLEAYGSGGGTGNLRPAPCPAEYHGGPGSQAAAFACEQIGKPYSWGSAGPSSYDCSGLTSAAWRQAGVHLPHNAAQQRWAIPYVDRSELRPGDLVFFYGDLSHVGIYVGDGWMVDAFQPGQPVQMRSIHRPGTIHSFGRPG
jgi:peptidoglycan DL-endopeptidase CwlO